MKTKTTVRERILNLLRKATKPLDAKTIAKRGKLNYNTVRKELGALQNLWPTTPDAFLVMSNRQDNGRLGYHIFIS